MFIKRLSHLQTKAMENPVEFFRLPDNMDLIQGCSNGLSSYVSCIKINGRPILPPLMTEEKRKEAKKYKLKAVEIEQKITERKRTITNRISSGKSSFGESLPLRQSTPARPATLNLLAKHYVSPTTELEPVKDDSTAKTKITYHDHHQFISSQTSTKNFRSTLEQRLANEDVVFRNRKNKLKQSPILEEHYPVIINEYAESDDSKKERKRWSPLKIDSLNSLRIELPSKDVDWANDSLEDPRNSSDTVTPSPSLLRQNSYTLLTPSPALLNYLESQKNNTQRSHSGRKTWDLTKAKRSWDPDTGKLCKSLDEGQTTDESERIQFEKRNFSCGNLNSTPKASPRKLFVDDGSTSPSSCNSKINSRSKTRSKKTKPYKNVPSPQAIDLVPSNNGSDPVKGALNVPSEVKRELAELSDLLLKMKMEHEKQKKELEEKQRVEIKQIESIFKRRETEILSIVNNQSCKKYQRSIYSQYTNYAEAEDFDARMTGDGSHVHSDPNSIGKIPQCYQDPRFEYRARPHSAKDIHPQYFNVRNKFDRRSRSVDFNQGSCNQDTDLDVSFQEDSMLSKDITIGNEDFIESDSMSNFSSRSSTVSSETRQETIPLLEVKQFKMIIPPEEYERYNKAATLITAAARGFLTRRLLRTAHVQGLITTLRDAISCATQLHSASDLGDSDIDLMRRLGRQIEAAWDAVYSVFFNTETSDKLQLISADRERLKNTSLKSQTIEPQRRISSATEKSLNRKKFAGSLMSRSQTSNGCRKTRLCSKMSASYPSPGLRYKLK